jgi:hypothetical protein
MTQTHPLIQKLREVNPDRIDVLLDGKPILTIKDGERVFECQVDLGKPHFLMTIHLDTNPAPVYTVQLA